MVAMKIILHIWRQDGPETKGAFKTYQLDGVSPHMSFLEMLDVLNEKLISNNEEPVVFEHDCREGICGCCGLMINGQAHGPDHETTACQLHMRKFKEGDHIWIEPWRAGAFPVIRDLMVDRSALDRIMQAGGYVSVNTGNAPEANTTIIPKQNADDSFDAATCIGCGACVAACKNASAMLFVSAKVSQFALLPQGQPERSTRVENMLNQMDKEGFGGCTNTNECEAACPAGISVENIARLNREFIAATLTSKK